ncbi:hypothetical protein OH76DRAFT_367092 [Lentinus brumalis]|uniref:Uncharacterized protein n=1 Tax=Lentinus brumalis TaxID=2498619 RepID=A0A371DE85_9APHY|nr:hypothetical protein OH76DRAFT_367092 [Polyporus brumalis]
MHKAVSISLAPLGDNPRTRSASTPARPSSDSLLARHFPSRSAIAPGPPPARIVLEPYSYPFIRLICSGLASSSSFCLALPCNTHTSLRLSALNPGLASIRLHFHLTSRFAPATVTYGTRARTLGIDVNRLRIHPHSLFSLARARATSPPPCRPALRFAHLSHLIAISLYGSYGEWTVAMYIMYHTDSL